MGHKHHHEESPAGDHRAAGPKSVAVQVITVSDTRDAAGDRSGAALSEILGKAGHQVKPVTIVPDEPERIVAAIADAERDPLVRAIVLNGGTGIAPRDRTIEAVTPLLDRVLPGFGEIFRTLSFEEIGSAAFLSRAIAGIRGKRAIFALPGSTAAVTLAANRLIVPELGHIVRELDK